MDGVLFPLFFSGNVSSTNVSGYHDERVDELLAEARAELDGTRRIALLQEADAAIGRDCPVIPLMFQGTPYVGSERIEGASHRAAGAHRPRARPAGGVAAVGAGAARLARAGGCAAEARA